MVIAALITALVDLYDTFTHIIQGFFTSNGCYCPSTIKVTLKHRYSRILLWHDPIWWDIESWWRHQMETFSALLAICAGNSPVSGEFPAQRSVTRSFDVLFDLRLIKRLSKHSWGWWFEMPSHPLWCHCNDTSLQWLRQNINQSLTPQWHPLTKGQ